MPSDHASFQDTSLPPHPHRIALTGSMGTLAWPDICPNCGEPASERLTVRKVFRRKRYRQPWHFVIRGLDIPFCGRCVARHRALEDSPPWHRGWFSVLLSPLMIPLAGSIFLGWIFPPDLAVAWWLLRDRIYD